MITIKKKKSNKNQVINFNSFLGNIDIFFIDSIFIIPKKIKITKKDNFLFFKNVNTNKKLSLLFNNNINIFFHKNKLFLSIISKNKKKILNLYNKLIKIKIKGILQGFKLNLFLKGIGYKFSLDDSTNQLILKLGFSHNIIVQIPEKIKIIKSLNNNYLIFSSIDLMELTQFVHYIKSLKKPEPYKGKGLLLKNENIKLKEGKKNKK